MSERGIRRRLLEWYEKRHRKLPWRETKDPYRIWVSEIMLQQTRVAAVLRYYENFLARFPSVEELARAPEDALLAQWSGLGYYSRARNLQRAARQIVQNGGFPRDYNGIRALAGVGEYTAAAIASIAFGLPHAVLDGNVLRVLSRLENDAGEIRSSLTRKRLAERAAQLLDRRRPGQFNQAMMELGAMVCLPKKPLCSRCPLSSCCAARTAGTQTELPVKARRTEVRRIETAILVIERKGKLLMRRRPADAPRLAGFWELPEAPDAPEAQVIEECGEFVHAITNHAYRIAVFRANLKRPPEGFEWVRISRLPEMPVSSTARKALELAGAGRRDSAA